MPASTWQRRFTVKLIVCYVISALFLCWSRPLPWSLLIGTPLLLLGEAVRIWGTGHLRKNEAVISSGPYAFIRDPLYLGTLLITSGFCIAARTHELLILVWAVFFFYYMPYKVRREGDRLSRRFGAAYDAYRAKVFALFPRLPPYRGADAGARWSAALVRENSEVGTAVAVVVIFVLLVLKWFFFEDFTFPKWRLL